MLIETLLNNLYTIRELVQQLDNFMHPPETIIKFEILQEKLNVIIDLVETDKDIFICTHLQYLKYIISSMLTVYAYPVDVQENFKIINDHITHIMETI